MLLLLVVVLSAGSGLYVGASFFAPQDVTTTSTVFTTTTILSTSTILSTVTQSIQGILTIIEYTSSTSTTTVTGATTTRTAKVVTAKGTAQITTAQSVFGGASGVFDGTTAYLSTPDSPDWTFGSGDFTIDFWVRFNSLPANGIRMIMFMQYDQVSVFQYFDLINNSGTYQWRFMASNGIAIAKNSPGLSTATWYHIALVRSGNNWYIFQGGTQVGTTGSSSLAVPDVSGIVTIGQSPVGGSNLNGWLDEYQISNGIARWTSNFTPPTSAYTSDSNTVLLLHMDGTEGSTSFIDSTS